MGSLNERRICTAKKLGSLRSSSVQFKMASLPLGKPAQLIPNTNLRQGEKCVCLEKGVLTGDNNYNQAPLSKYRLENPKPLEILLNLKTEDSTLDKCSTVC